MTLRLSALFSCCALLLVSSAEAKTYPIQLNRSLQVGQRYHLKTNGTYHREMNLIVNSTPMRQKKETITLDYAAEVTIMAVSAQGRARKERHQIVHFFKHQNGGKQPLLKAGMEVIAWMQKGKMKFFVQKAPVKGALAQYLGDVISLKADDQPDDDVIMGTKKPQAIGASWPVNPKASRFLLGKKTAANAPKLRKGRVTLVGRSTVHKIPCLNLKVHMELDTLQMKIPYGWKLTKSTAQFDMSGHFPLDHKMFRLRDTKAMNLQVVAQRPAAKKAPPMQMTMVMRYKQSSTRRPLPAKATPTKKPTSTKTR